MPHVERYFRPRHFDSSFEPCVKKSKLDYSALCKQEKTEQFIPLDTPSEKENSSGFSETRYYGSVKAQKPRVRKDFLNGLGNEAKTGSSRNYTSEADSSRKESKPDYSALCKKRNFEEYIPLEIPSENWSPSGLLETRYHGSHKGEHEKPRVCEDFINAFDNEAEPESSRNYSFEAHYTRIESKPDNSSISKKRNTEEYLPLERQSENQSPSRFPETGCYRLDSGEHEKSKVEDFLNGFDNEARPGSSKNYCSELHFSRTEDSNKNQQILGLPKTDKWKNNNSETFSVTSTAFIGPLYQPPAQVDTLSRTTNNENRRSPSFMITTLVSGKAACRTKGEGGIDYELRQFYKELHALETADDCNIVQTTDGSQKHFDSHQSNAPTVHEVRDHHNQERSPQPCNPFPCKPSAVIPPRYHPNEAPVSPPKHPILPPNNNQDSCYRPMPFDRTNSSLVTQSLPLPCFQGLPPPPCFQGPPPPPCFRGPPPPAFVVNRGPPLPRYNYPLIFPREDDVQNSPYQANEKYHRVNDDHPRPTTQAPWHSSHVLPQNRFNPQGSGFTEPSPKPPFESSQVYQQREDFHDQKGRHFSEIRLPQGGNMFHEQYPSSRDEAKCTDLKRKLVLLRGVPGSGKSTLARILLEQSPDGIVFSTDDYFCQENGYAYDVKLLGDAHNWNQNRAQRAMDDGRSPIIIDNTNIQAWEMKPYVQMALDRGYAVDFLEPNTWWKLDPHELEKRNTHRVPREKISQMLERFEHDMNVGVVMNSVEPRRVRHRRPPAEDRQRWGASVDYTLHSPSFQIR